jgi:spermidine/putrescine-binding protein
MVVLASSKAPVLAHLFLNYFQDPQNAIENISYNGYIQPLTEVTPQLLVKEKILPPSLMSTAVLPSYFRKGLFELELPPTTDVEWEQDWLEFSGGL